MAWVVPAGPGQHALERRRRRGRLAATGQCGRLTHEQVAQGYANEEAHEQEEQHAVQRSPAQARTAHGAPLRPQGRHGEALS